MIKHVVCFKLKDKTEENMQNAISTLLSMKDNVPTVREIEVHRDFLESPRSYDIMLEVTLDDKETLDVYQNDAYHCSVVKELMHRISEKSVSIDYKI
ncbi:MAG: Dabb family protein [Christensenellales bacterium]